jgi:hypothetical protein
MSDCTQLECCFGNDLLLGDLAGFSIVGGDYPGGSINGNPESTFIVDCPPGQTCAPGEYPKLVTIPKNTVINPYPPYTGEPIIIHQPCATSGGTTRYLPAGSTLAQINAAIADALLLCAKAIAEEPTPGGWTVIQQTYTNDEVDPVECDEDKKFSSDPGGILDWDDSTKLASFPKDRVVSLVSKADANNLADGYIADQIAKFLAGGGSCGYWNTAQQKCPPDGPIAAANTFFSAVSQAQADQDALDSLAECACDANIDALTWTPAGSGTASGSGAEITWDCSAAGVALTSSAWDSTPTGVTCQLSGSFTVTGAVSLGLARSGGGYESLWGGVYAPGTHNISQVIVIPSSILQLLFLTVNAGGAGNACSGYMRVGPV